MRSRFLFTDTPLQSRRHFLASASAGAIACLAWRPAWSADAGAKVEVLLDEPVGTIAPEIYGHFTEHLGGLIYDGVWVGENSKIPNERGIRKALLDGLRRIGAPVIRWPGGCFADSYDWHDGIGARKNRPTHTGFWEDRPESNAFGTDEFMRFCRLSGAAPYLAANLRSLPAQSFSEWVEYCNAPAGTTDLAKRRAANGSATPYDVRHWGIGNESWGCGGNFSAEEYAQEFRRFTSYVPLYGRKLDLIGAGPGGDDSDWTERFFEAMKRKTSYSPPMTGWSVHHYVDDLGQGAKGDALAFGADEWSETLRRALLTETIIEHQWDILGRYDPNRSIRLVVDEYGGWWRPGSELDPSHLLGQQSTLRDALLTAMTLDIFNRHADKVAMANCAQLINCLNALFFAHEDKFAVTPVFHVFDLYRAHQGGQSLGLRCEAPEAAPGLTGLAGSASRRDGKITLTLTNPSSTASIETQIAVKSAGTARISAVLGRVLGGGDIHAHNDFTQVDVVHPADLAVDLRQGMLTVRIPAAAVARLEIDLV